jgi:chromosomal replication initiation ATPase DnaA
MNPYIYPGIGSLQVRLQIEAQAKSGKRPKAPITMDEVLEASIRGLNEFHGITFTKEYVLSKTRKREAVEMRQCTMYLVKKYFHSSKPLKAMGAFFNGRDHSTVIHGVETWFNLMETDSRYKRLTEEIKSAAELISDLNSIKNR